MPIRFGVGDIYLEAVYKITLPHLSYENQFEILIECQRCLPEDMQHWDILKAFRLKYHLAPKTYCLPSDSPSKKVGSPLSQPACTALTIMEIRSLSIPPTPFHSYHQQFTSAECHGILHSWQHTRYTKSSETSLILCCQASCASLINQSGENLVQLPPNQNRK